MIRIVLAACLSLLLLGLQQQSVVHEFQHDGARLADTRAALHSSSHGTCAICALIAGGTHGVARAIPATSPLPGDHVAAVAVHSRTATAFTRYYSSRAPPVLA
jgi:hypothetical protein